MTARVKDLDSGLAVIVDTAVEADGEALLGTAPTGCLGQTVPREATVGNTNLGPTSGAMCIASLYLKAGTVVTNINYVAGTTSAVTPTNWWFGLLDNNYNALAFTADQTTTAFASGNLYTLPLTAQVRTTYSGVYYATFCMVAGTMPTLAAVGGNASSNGIAPVKSANATTGLTGPPTLPFQAGSIVAKGPVPWAYLT